MKKSRVISTLIPIASVVFIILLWQMVSVITDNEIILPSIRAVLVSAVELLKDGAFYSAYLSTLVRTIIAFSVSFLLALITAILSKRFFYYKKAVSPIIKIMRALPTVAIVLLLYFWTNSLVAPVIVTTLVVFPTLTSFVSESLNTVDYKQIEMCKVFGVSNKDLLFKVQIKEIAPSMLNVIGEGISLNLKLMVAAEVLSATFISLGNMLNRAKYYVEIPRMIAIVLLCVLTGLLIEFIFGLISKKVGKWQCRD